MRDKWKRIIDEVPPKDKLVLACGKMGGMFIGCAWRDRVNPAEDEYMYVLNSRRYRSATHWMYLPEEPIKEKK
jgi:hypothetical protein